MNVRVFLLSVFVAAVIVAVILLVAVDLKGTKFVPKPTQTTGPTSQLIQPKPSPLNPQALRVTNRPQRHLDHLDP
jgi:hypothetical protein